MDKKVKIIVLTMAIFLLAITAKSYLFSDKNVKGDQAEIKKYKALQMPNDTYVGNQWALPKTKTPEGWDVTTGNETVKIAVLDTGILTNHQDLAGKLVTGYDFIGRCPNGYDYEPDNSVCLSNQVIKGNNVNPANGGGEAVYHGTMVAGIVAAATNNSQGIAGTCWSCKIMPIRVLNNDGEGTSDIIAQGIRYAVDNGAKVINLSLGYANNLGPDSYLTSAIDYAYENNVTVIAAAGNDGAGINYPAAYPKVIAVGAIDSSSFRPSWSSTGSEIDVMAPGVSVLSPYTYWNNSAYVTNVYANASGTSMSAPMVSGLAGLIASHQAEATNDTIMQLLKNNTDKIGGYSAFSNDYGHGLINSQKTLSSGLALSVTTGLSISNNNPAVGEDLTATFTIRNLNPSPITLDNLGVAARSAGTNVDMGWLGPVTLAGYNDPENGDSRTVSVHRIQSSLSGVNAWISYNYQGNFYEATPQATQTTSLSYQTKVPNIYASSPLSISPDTLTEGQSGTFTTTIRSNDAKRIYYSHLGIANRNTNSGTNADIGWLGSGYIEPGETKALSFNKTLSSGHYRAWSSIHLGDNFYEVWDGAKVNQLIFDTVPLEQKLPVNVNLSLSNNTPAIGEEVTATYSIQNQTGSNITLQKLGVANRGPSWSNQDYPWLQNITINSNAQYNLSVKRINTDIGEYIAWPSFQYGNNWYAPSSQKVYSVHFPNIKATSLISQNPVQPQGNQSATYSVNIKNNESKRIYYSHLGLANRNTASGANADIGWLGAGYLEPGETKNLQFNKVLYQGSYFSWSSIHIGAAFYQIWDGANVNHLYFATK